MHKLFIMMNTFNHILGETETDEMNLDDTGGFKVSGNVLQLHGLEQGLDLIVFNARRVYNIKVSSPSPLHNVLFVQYVFLPTEQTETYFKICILTYDLTYICPGLFDWKENTFFFIFVYFKL